MDHGCGTGLLSLAAALAGYRDITCADVCSTRLKTLRERAAQYMQPGHSFKTAQLIPTEFDYFEEAFDVLVMQQAHVRKLEALRAFGFA